MPNNPVMVDLETEEQVRDDKHNALSDALYQVEYVRELRNKLVTPSLFFTSREIEGNRRKKNSYFFLARKRI